jgi:hypothetical protein
MGLYLSPGIEYLNLEKNRITLKAKTHEKVFFNFHTHSMLIDADCAGY